MSDGSQADGTAGFFFLPPLVPMPASTGVFEGALEPRVEIDELNPATSEVLRRVASLSSSLRGDHYQAEWHTRDYALASGSLCRIRVLLDEFSLGFIDVTIVRNGGPAKKLDVLELVNGSTLPIKFRIERQAVDPDHDDVLLSNDNCPAIANPDQLDTDGDGKGDACECAGVMCSAGPCERPGRCRPTTGDCSSPQAIAGCVPPVTDLAVACGHLRVDRAYGLAPLSVRLDAKGFAASAPENIDWDLDGDGSFELVGTSLDASSHVYAQPGMYRPTVRLTSSSVPVCTIANTVEAVSPTLLLNALQSRWDVLADALNARNTELALAQLSAALRGPVSGMLEQSPDAGVQLGLRLAGRLSLRTLAETKAFTEVSSVGAPTLLQPVFVLGADGSWRVESL